MYKYMDNVSQVFKKTKGFIFVVVVYMVFFGRGEYVKLVLELTYFFKSMGEGGGIAEKMAHRKNFTAKNLIKSIHVSSGDVWGSSSWILICKPLVPGRVGKTTCHPTKSLKVLRSPFPQT